jgi:radial spoke head protein 9
MKVETLAEDLRLLWPTGTTLSLEERMNIELGLLKLYEHEDFEEVHFWGRVRGVAKDYYIAMTVNFRGHYEFAHKRFFWCNAANWTFAELPAINPNDRELAEQFNGFFTGESDKILVEAPEQEAGDDPPRDEIAEDQDSLASTVEEKVPPKNFTEIDRLTYVVRGIEQDCSVVPEGAFRMTPGHEIAHNRGFAGLTTAEIGKPEKYFHFRNVQLPEKRDQLDRDDALFSYDFLDPIMKDQPKGCWSVQVDPSKTLSSVRSLIWPGYFAYHQANTTKFGGVYFGDGIKNSDLPFML